MEVNDNLRLAVGWCSQQDFNDMQELVAASSVSSDGEVGNARMQERKSMGRYEIYLETQN